MKVIVAGSRSIQGYETVDRAIQKSGFEITEIVSGTCPGPDLLGEQWAEKHGIPVKRFPADWDNLDTPGAVIKTNRQGKRYNAKAGHDRNAQMADYADAAILAWDGSSNGTADMRKLAESKGLEWMVYRVDTGEIERSRLAATPVSKEMMLPLLDELSIEQIEAINQKVRDRATPPAVIPGQILVTNGKRDGWLGTYIGRQMGTRKGSPLANPYKAEKKTAEAHEIVCALYKQWLWRQIKGDGAECDRVRQELQRLKLQTIQQGIRLDCWCKDLPCHGDVVKACIEWAIATDFDFWHEPKVSAA